MYPIHKKVKVLKPFCPKCLEQLKGDGSYFTPWKCSCGTWKNSFSDPFNYKVTKE